MADPKSTVTSFLTALERDDVEGALTFAAPEMVYQNVPLPPARGVAAVEKQLRLLSRYRIGFEARVHHIAADGPIVLTERTDVLRVGSWDTRFWVCGTFEVRDGRIVLWRDYFDWATVLASSVRGAGRAAVTGVSTLVARARLRD
ncbi:limonene-1,2-epoxide hydrolase family protein [Amycolatopsis tucumanensis]|uniref:limonene-1,2-epoxide hydrolase family protein n=1 Tax=Amycolatopsis tucumanensis TaxID=401106 RepID=UPI003D74F549